MKTMIKTTVVLIIAVLIGTQCASAQSTISSSDSLNFDDSLGEDDDDLNKVSTVDEDDEDEDLDVHFNDDVMSKFAQQEIDAFNFTFLTYQGPQTGSNINALITRLIANVKTYKNELTKVPYVCYCNENKSNTLIKPEKDSSNQQNYIDDLTLIKNKIEPKHTYYVYFSYQENELIDYIHIFYEEDEEATLLNR